MNSSIEFNIIWNKFQDKIFWFLWKFIQTSSIGNKVKYWSEIHKFAVWFLQDIPINPYKFVSYKVKKKEKIAPKITHIHTHTHWANVIPRKLYSLNKHHYRWFYFFSIFSSQSKTDLFDDKYLHKILPFLSQ